MEATCVCKLDGWMEAYLWKLEYGGIYWYAYNADGVKTQHLTQYVITSSTPQETMCFPATKDGEVASWGEKAVGKTKDHIGCLMRSGVDYIGIPKGTMA